MTPSFLFGREREIRVLEELLARAGAEGSALVIRGEAGIGKSPEARYPTAIEESGAVAP